MVTKGVLAEPKEGWRFDAVEEAAGFPLDASRREALGTWLSELCVWNARMDLTAAKTPDELIELMVTDALVLAAEIPPSIARKTVVDVGTGAGAPGLALAFVRPDLALTLVDPLNKRIAFLRTILGRLRRSDVTLVTGHGEKLGKASFDVAVSRATLNPEEWVALGMELVRPGGTVFALLASNDAAHDPSGRDPAGSRNYAWPFSGRGRRIVRYPRDVVISQAP
ncbi:hypothetical protein BH09MYX1_BH09MYX1_18450 [soil metagenome]